MLCFYKDAVDKHFSKALGREQIEFLYSKLGDLNLHSPMGSIRNISIMI